MNGREIAVLGLFVLFALAVALVLVIAWADAELARRRDCVCDDPRCIWKALAAYERRRRP